MVFYFSGTGNSQLAAKQIANELGDEIVSINDCIKSGEKRVFKSERPIIFVAPVYAWRIPRVVEKWIGETSFDGNQNAYFVLTCGGSGGNAGAYAEKLCREKGFNYRGLVSVNMPENYIAMAEAPSESECEEIIARAKPIFSKLAEQIASGEVFTQAPISFKDRIISGPVNTLFYSFYVKDKGFTVSDACISCNKCEKLCPINNIDMVNGKPVWRGNCTHCMACICACPTEAIEYKSISKGKRRYYIVENN